MRRDEDFSDVDGMSGVVVHGDEQGDAVVVEQGARLMFASAHGIEDLEVVLEPSLHVVIVHVLNDRRLSCATVRNCRRP